MTVRYLTGDVRDVLATIPDGTVDLVLTSPPFLALRSYLPADHADKHREIGSEPTPATFLDTLLDLTVEWARVLAPHGSIAIELGDTYSGSGGHGGDYAEGGLRDGQPKFDGAGRRQRDERHARGGDDEALRRRAATKRDGMYPHPGWPPAKSLCMMPQLYAASLSYGRNLLTGRELDPWRVRNIVRWCRPNPPVGALGDKFRPATSEMTVACKARDRYFDLDAVRTPLTEPDAVKTHSTEQRNPSLGWAGNSAGIVQNAGFAPPLDWWEIPTQPYKGSHYATWPERLCVRPILAMCPERVCTTCGQPSRRIATAEYVKTQATNNPTPRGATAGVNGAGADPTFVHGRARKIVETVGWSDCGHGTWRRGVVLDPFAGSGTTLVVAHRLGRDAIGIDLDSRNAELYEQRIAQHEGGLFLDAPAEPAWVDVELPL